MNAARTSIRRVITPIVAQARMASPSGSESPSRICEGVFAINKPSNISSAQVIREVQSHFNPSPLFRPWFDQERARRDAESNYQRARRKSWKQRQPLQLKMGHGGTLDPMATGVLILGIGSGTKQLTQFIECTKSYEAVVLFGVATDSYDAVGKVVASKPHGHVTKNMVQEALQKFRGRIMQRPPIFSALRVQGKRLYEYAREGKDVPVEVEERPMEVEQLEMLEWMEGGTHDWQWPTEVAGTPERQVTQKTLRFAGDEGAGTDKEHNTPSSKRKFLSNDVGTDKEDAASPKRPRTATAAVETSGNQEAEQDAAPLSQRSDTMPQTSSPCPAPACRLRMTVTSGFYVRSLCHDLGAAVGSLALMSSLVRTRQGAFEINKNVLEYSDLDKGDEVWEPKVESMLQAWQAAERDRRPKAEANTCASHTQRLSPKSSTPKNKDSQAASRTSLRPLNGSGGDG